MNNYKETIQQICEARGNTKHKDDAFYWIVEQRMSKVDADRWLRGFLLEPDTLRTWFGEEKFCPRGDKLVKKYAVSGDYLKCTFCGTTEIGDLFSWQYHAQQMIGMSIEEMLKYFKDNKR